MQCNATLWWHHNAMVHYCSCWVAASERSQPTCLHDMLATVTEPLSHHHAQSHNQQTAGPLDCCREHTTANKPRSHAAIVCMHCTNLELDVVLVNTVLIAHQGVCIHWQDHTWSLGVALDGVP